MYGFYCINGLKMTQFEKLSNKKIFEVKILKGWYPPRLRKFCKNRKIEVLGRFIEFGWFGWPDMANCDSWQQYVATNGGQGADKSILGPRIGPFRPNFSPKMTKIKVFDHFIEFG